MFIPVITSFLTVSFNLVIGSTLIIVPLRLKEAGAGIFAITGTLSIWAVVCAVCAWLVGRILTEQNARRLVQTGTALYFLCFLGLLLVPGVQMQYFWLLLLGIATAVYCAPFQVFLKTLENGKQAGLVRASALYSASWSFGMAVGPFLFSMLSAGADGMAWQLAYGINAVLMIPIFFLPVLAEKLAVHSNRTSTTEPTAPTDDFSSKPDLALWGWLLTVAAFAAVATTKSLLPEQGPDAHYSETQVSLMVSLIYFAHSFTSLCLIRSKEWMYRASGVTAGTVCGIAGLLLFVFGFGNVYSLYAGSILIGIFSGVVGFCLVFYSLAHPEKAGKYVAVNEITVGTTNTLSPLLIGGGLVWLTGWNGAPYLALTVLAAVIGLLYLKRMSKIKNS
ncbi:MAG: MFS transporter [Lentisphaeria bacterium]|nr:MFS transporter [Lentisphaeria bacterium]